MVRNAIDIGFVYNLNLVAIAGYSALPGWTMYLGLLLAMLAIVGFLVMVNILYLECMEAVRYISSTESANAIINDHVIHDGYFTPRVLIVHERRVCVCMYIICKIILFLGNEVIISPQSQILRIGENATITCQLQTGDAAFIWFFLPLNHAPDLSAALVLQDSQHNLSVQGVLSITNFTLDNAGSYLCEKLMPPSCLSNRSVLTVFGKFLCNQM